MSEQSNEAIQANSEQTERILIKALSKRRNVMLVGAPGVGKTCIVTQAAKKAEMDVVVFHPVISDPTDFKGMPAVIKNDGNDYYRAKFIPFDSLEILLNADKPTVAFADDLGQAPPMVQAAWMQLVLSRKLDNKVVSDNVTFVGATNRKGDKAGVKGILEPLKSRFHTIIELIVDVDAWLNWARNKEAHIHPYIRAFIRWRGISMLHSFLPTNDMTNTPNPRTVEHVSDLLWDSYDEEVRPIVIAGAAGGAFATEFEAFVQLVKELPKMRSIIKNPKECRVPSDDNVSAQYSIIEAMLDIVNINIIDSFLIYIKRFKPEFQQWFITQLKEHKPECTITKAFTDWAVDFGIE